MTLPDNCPIADDITEEIKKVDRRGPVPFVTLMDFVKIIIIVVALSAGWYRMENGIGEIRQEEAFTKERIIGVEKSGETRRVEINDKLDRMNDKLDRLIERKQK